MKRVLLASVMLLAFLGCTAPEDKAGSSDSAQVKAEKSLEIAVIPKSLSHQFWMQVRAGAEAAGKEAGASILWQGTAKETEVVKQIDIVQDMISRGVDALVLAACDENALIGPVEKATQKKIPVITIDSGVKSEAPLSFVATDNIKGAEIAAQTLAKLIGEEGEVGLIPFVPGAATSEMREQGFKTGLKAFPKMKLVSTLYCMSDVAKAMDVTQDMLTSNPEIKGIFAANEAAAIGAAQALRAKGLTGKVKLVAFDASEEEINSLKEGVIQALIVQNPFNMGYLGVRAALDALQDKPVERRIDTGIVVVTKENLDSPEVQKLFAPVQ